MEATDANIRMVREALGETIPDSGTESDTLFTNEQVTGWLQNSVFLDAASYRGWLAKLALLVDLVNVTDGAASRELSDAHDHALAMVKLYAKLALGPASGRTRVGKIVRRS